MGGVPELVIFDCDGVLVDSERLSIRLDLVILDHFGIDLPREEVIGRFMGRSEGLVEAMIEETIGRSMSAEEHTWISTLYRDCYEAELNPVEGVVEALASITHLRSCVASSSRPDGLRWKLEHCGLLDHFGERLFSATQVPNGKPAPDLFLLAADTLGADPARCVVVEDSPYGVQAARAAGMRALAYETGMVPAERLIGPDTILFDDMRALPELLATS